MTLPNARAEDGKSQIVTIQKMLGSYVELLQLVIPHSIY